MKLRALGCFWALGLLWLAMPACQGGGGGYSPPAAAAPETAPPTSPATPSTPYAMGGGMGGYGMMGPGMQQNFGMMSNNMYQMHQMGQGYMSPDHYNQMRGMMGQMGGMMHEMGGPYYTPETEQRQRQQLEQMHQSLSSMQSQGVVGREGASRGAQLFSSNCAGCHPNGGNAIDPDLPIRGSQKLASFDTFLAFMRHPRMPDGSRGAMPAFSPRQLSILSVLINCA